MGGRTAQLLVAVALALAAIPSVASAGVVEGASFYTLPPATHAYSMTAGPEGAVWFTGSHAGESGEPNGVVGRVTQSGEVEVFELPPERRAGEIVAGPDGNLWFTEVVYTDRPGSTVARLGRMTPAGEFGEYRIGEHIGSRGSMTVGPDGRLWFLSGFWKKGRRKATIARFDIATGKLKRFHLPPRGGPSDIVAGPDGNIWFTELGEGEFSRVGRITPQGRIAHFPLPDKRLVAGPIAVGPDGNLWFGERPRESSPGGRVGIGRIDAKGRIGEFRLPARSFLPALVSGPAGRLWYAARTGRGNLGIGSLSRDGTPSELDCLQSSPECEIDADALAVGPDGALWFSASKYWPHMGGGGSGIFESMAEAKEAGLIGRLAP